jgi:hypothetical protein
LALGSGIDVGSYYAAAKALGDLVGYWRLGDADEPYLDTSEFDPADPADLSIDAGTDPMTKDVDPGALPSTWDDGAVAFPNLTDKVEHIAGGSSTFGTADEQDYLTTTLASGTTGNNDRFRFVGNVPFSVAAWVWLLPEAVETFDGGIMNCLTQSDAAGRTYFSGWKLTGRWAPAQPSAAVWFDRGQPTNAVAPTAVAAYAPADQWFHVCGTYDGTSAIKLYINGGLADSDTDTHALVNNDENQVWIGHEGRQEDFGGVGLTGTYYADLYGKVDEASIWSKELTAGEVASLAALGNITDAEEAGKVLTANGTGGTSWEWPTIEVTY